MGCCGSNEAVKVKEDKTNEENKKDQEVIEPAKIETKKKDSKEEEPKKEDLGEKQEVFTKQNFNQKKFLQQELAEHNRLRSLHGAGPLKLNNDLVEMAQKYAEVLAKKKTMQHSKKEDRKLKGHEGEWVGENLYYFWTSETGFYTSGAMSQSWYDEIKDYEIGRASCRERV